MLIDLACAFIFIAMAIDGFRRGAVRTLFGTLGWVVAVFSAILFREPTERFLLEHTGLYERIYGHIFENISESVNTTTQSLLQGMPDALEKPLSGATNAATAATADSIAHTVFSILALISAVLLIRLLLFVLRELFSKKNRRGMVGFGDGILGLCIGVVKGAILVFLFLAFLAVVVAMGVDLISEMLEDSYFSGYLYDNNKLLELGQELFR